MRSFVPDPRVDQEQEYWTSHHGKALRRGDERVATCADCHQAHGVLGPASTRSPVHPKNVAETCRVCHEDPQRMAATLLPGGGRLPIDQYARWRRSVHAAALLEREDLSAPTCNDCHGNHGATPPGVDSIAFVCGHCHSREAALFRASPKRDGHRRHAELMLEAEGEGCAACHGPEEPQSRLERVTSFSECTTCHGNHAILRPVLAMLEPSPGTPCRYCHLEEALDDNASQAALRVQERFLEKRGQLLAEADSGGLQGDERFDWLLEQVLALEPHTEPDPGGGRRPRPAFGRLYEKLRLGPIYRSLDDSVAGEPAREAVVRCSDCHAEVPSVADQPSGLLTAQRFVDEITLLSGRIADAERLLLAAQRGGVETRGAADEIDQAVEAEIELAVLVHTFEADDESDLIKAAERGRIHAGRAAVAAEEALSELSFRRRGLVVSLGIMVLVLGALAMKIRSIGG
jgi:hypothetical protein